MGFAAARDRNGTDENIVAVLGDAALTNGVTFEAFNNIATTTKRMIVVLNDNEMSIAKNVGAIAKYLNEVITNPRNNRLYSDMNAFVKNLFGEPAAKFTEKVARDAKGFILPSSFFEYFGFMYLGPIDGHDIPLLEKYLNYCKRSTKPILLHVLTKKGKGLDAAVRNPEKFHGATPYDIVTGESTSNSDKSVPNYQDAMGKTLLKLAQKDPKIVGITAAMASGTGLSFLKKTCQRSFSTLESPRSTPRFSPRAWRARVSGPSPRFIPLLCSAPMTAPCTTSASKSCPSLSASTARGSAPTTGRPTTDFSTYPF